jgi:tight adherence protein C
MVEALPSILIVIGGVAIAAAGVLASTDHPASGVAGRDGSSGSRIPAGLLVPSVVLALCGVGLGAVLWIAFGFSTTVGLATCLLLATAGALAPKASADRREERRLRAGDRGVADFAGLLSVELRSGLGVDAALENVAGELDGVLVDEMLTLSTQVRLGMPRGRALELLRERLPAPNVERLVQALQHAGELGAPVAETLRKLADDCTVRQYQQVREDAAKLPVKMLFPVMFCIFPPMLVLLAGPAMVSITEALS